MSSSEQPRPRDAAATRTSLLDAAQTVFARDGFSGARIDDIAQVAQFNKSLIFQYFTDKAGLYRAVIQRFRESSDAAFMTALSPHFADAPAPSTAVTRERIVAIVEASLHWSFAHLRNEPEYLRLFSWELAEGWRTFETTESPDVSGQAGFALLTEAQQIGVLRSDLSIETVLAQLTMLPFITVASIPRFAGDLDDESFGNHVGSLCEHTIALFLHSILPDQIP